MNNTQFRDLSEDIIVFHNKNELPYIKVPHLHSSYEIYYNINGAKGFMVNGNVYRCEEKDLIIVPKVQTHKVIVRRNCKYERCIINISENVVGAVENVCEKDAMLWLKEGIKKANLSESQHNTFVKLIKEYNTGDKLMNFSKFLEIMSFLKGVFEKPTAPEYLNEDISYTDRAIIELEKSFKSITVGEIAAQLFINEDYITRLFKEETGMTLKSYITLRKIAEAKKFLYLGKSVKEACSLSGFNNYANFIRTFKKYEGYPPGKLEKLTGAI